MKLKIAIGILLLWGLTQSKVYGQSTIDSTLKTMLLQKDSEKKLYDLLNFANLHVVKKPSVSLEAATSALRLSFNLKNKRGEAFAYSAIGTLHYNNAQYDLAIQNFNKALKLFKEVQEKNGEIYVLKHLGFAYEKQQNYNKALDYYNSYESNARHMPTKEPLKEQSKVKMGKVRSYEKTNQIEKSKQEVATIEQDSKGLPSNEKVEIYNELGEIFQEQSKDTLAINYYNNALNIADNAGLKPQISTYKNLNKLYTDAGNAEKALVLDSQFVQQLEKGLKSLEIEPFLLFEQTHWTELSKSYAQKGQFKEAYYTIQRQLNYIDSTKMQVIADSIEKKTMLEVLAYNEERINALEESRLAQTQIIGFQKTISVALSTGMLLLLIGVLALWKSMKQRDITNLKLRFQSLTNQMNPHFIYNSLNSVNLFIAKNQEKEANKFLADFSKLMRLTMENASKEHVSLKEEISLIEKYLELEHMRFSQRFNYEITVDPMLDLEQFSVPPMVIQPYIENAIWHGLRYRNDKGWLLLKIEQTNTGVICLIKDNGIGIANSKKIKTKNQENHQSTGMKNSHERIDILNKIHKKQLRVTVQNNDNEQTEYPGTCIQIEIPYS
jgi:tetratricopeptide (TPR) repeat protein